MREAMQRGGETWGYLIQAVPGSVASASNQDPNCDDPDEILVGSRVSQQTDRGNLAPALTRRVPNPIGVNTEAAGPEGGLPPAEVWLTELSSTNVTYTLGRRNCRVHVRQSIRQYISRDHCRLSSGREGGSLVAFVRDISANGTYVNGTRIDRHRATKLEDGDVISLVSPHVVESNNSGGLGSSLEAFLFVFREASNVPAPPAEAPPATATAPSTSLTTAATVDNLAPLRSFFTGSTGALQRRSAADMERNPMDAPRRSSGGLSIGTLSDFLTTMGYSSAHSGLDDSLTNDAGGGAGWLHNDAEAATQQQQNVQTAQRHVNRAMTASLRRMLPNLRRQRRPPYPIKSIVPQQSWRTMKMRRVVQDPEEVALR